MNTELGAAPKLLVGLAHAALGLLLAQVLLPNELVRVLQLLLREDGLLPLRSVLRLWATCLPQLLSHQLHCRL